jgi:DNA-binding SARP family transcriptional activator
MRFRILGPLEVYDSDGAPVRLLAPKQRALLMVLLLHGNESLSIGRIEMALWPGQPPRSAAGVVRTYISGLRRALRLDDEGSLPRLTKEPGGYRLVLAAADLDLAVFDDLSSRGRHALDHGEQAQAARLLSAALALWRGEPAAGIMVDARTSAIIAGLDERRQVAEEAWADAQLALGSGADLVGRLRRLAVDQPLRERVRAQLMLALYTAGRKAEALEEFRALRCRMIDELGVEPSAPLQKLHQRILSNDPALVAVPAPSLVPRQLPHDTSHFTGRDMQLTAMEATLSPADVTSPSIMIVTGMAGSGKTALALHFGHLVAHRFPDGQLFVDLRGHADAEPVPAAEALRRCLRALGAKDVPGDIDEAAAMYRSLLAGKRVLVLLDNAATASQARPLLPGSPGCLVLVTSRSGLHGLVAWDGGILVAVGPLEQSTSVAMLRKILGGLSRARRRRSPPAAQASRSRFA